MKFVGEVEALRDLASAGLPVVEHDVATGPGAAADAFDELGPRVVAKVSSRHVLHKSDFDGVRVGLTSADELRAAWKQFDEAHRARFDEPLPAMVVARQVSGVEVFVGARRDPGLGPMMVFGPGGILVELLRETISEQVPLIADDARRMIAGTRASELLSGFRGAPAADEDALVRLMLAVSALVEGRDDVLELDLNPVIVGPAGATVVDARIGVGEPLGVDDEPRAPVPPALFEPRSVAVVGASTDAAKPGGRVVRYLREHGYAGRIVPVHPTASEVAGLPAIASLAELPAPVDLAVIATPAAMVADLVRECDAVGIDAAIVFSAGFAESGAAGDAHERALADALQGARVRVAGPNCNGLVSPSRGVMTSFAGALDRPDIPDGGLALVTQSGAIGSSVVSRSWDAGIGFSRWISTGNEADLTLSDYLDFLAGDDRTEAILLFVESVRDPATFRRAALRCLERRKPVVAYKTGRSSIARTVIASHTGALAGEDAAYDAFFRRCGVVRVDTLGELVDVGRVLARGRIPRGDRAGVLTMSGGAASVIADACEARGLRLPELDPATQDRLAADIPAFGSYRNPVDATADAVTDPGITTRALQTLAAADDIDLLLVQLTTNADPSSAAMAASIVALESATDLPVVVARAGGDSLAPEGMAVYERAGLPVFDYPERLVAAAHGVVEYGRLVRQHEARQRSLERRAQEGR